MSINNVKFYAKFKRTKMSPLFKFCNYLTKIPFFGHYLTSSEFLISMLISHEIDITDKNFSRKVSISIRKKIISNHFLIKWQTLKHKLTNFVKSVLSSWRNKSQSQMVILFQKNRARYRNSHWLLAIGMKARCYTRQATSTLNFSDLTCDN